MALALALLVLAAGPLAAQHPRALVTRADVPRIRAMAADTARTELGYVPADGWKALKSQADAFLRAPAFHYAVEIPGERGRPGMHWEYTLSDARPPRHQAYTRYPAWTAMFQEGKDTISTRLKLLSFAYLVTKDARYLAAAKDIAMHLCAWPGIWTDQDYGGGKPCLDTGHSAEWVGLFYDWCYDGLTEAERATIRTALAEKALSPIDSAIDRLQPYDNYSAVLAAGLCIGAVVLRGEDPRADGWIRHAVARARMNFDAQGRDGGPMEGPVYGSYAAGVFADMIWALSTAGVANDLASHPYIASLPRYCISTLDLGTRKQVCFGDGGLAAGFGELMLVLALAGNTDAAWYCRQMGSLDVADVRRFLALDPSRVHPVEPTWSPSTCFVDVGYAILRDRYSPGSAFMGLKCGPPTKVVTHDHYDQNSFMLSFAGTWPAWDPGSRNYFDARKRRYTAGTLGHNTIVLDLDDAYLARQDPVTRGHDQVRLNGGKIAEFYAGRAFDYVLGDAGAAYNSARSTVLNAFTRQVVFAKPRVFFVRDTIAAPTAHTFSFLLHAMPGSALTTARNVIHTTGSGAALDAYVFAPGGTRMVARTYPAAERYGPYAAATTGPANQTTFTAVLVPYRLRALLANGGFENGFEGWQRRVMPGITENHVIDTTVAHSGKASGRIDNEGYYYSQRIPVVPGARVTARWWVKCTAATGASTELYYWRGGKSLGSTPGPSATVDDWMPFEMTDTAPEGAQEVSLALKFAGQGSCWYDDASLTTDSPVPMSEPARVSPIGDGTRGAIAEVDGVTHVLICGSAGKATRVDAAGHTLTTDAELAVVSFRPEGPRALVVEGTHVDVDGQPVQLDEGEWVHRRGG